MKKWHVYETEYADEGSVLIEAETEEEAKAKYHEMCGEASADLTAIEGTPESIAKAEADIDGDS